MATMVSHLLDVADLLIQEGSSSSAIRRRAVSTGYYAVFHALAKACADGLLKPINRPSLDRTSDEYSRVYRAQEHGSLKSAFSVQDSPLKKRKDLRAIGDLLIPSQSERHRADYLPPIRGVVSLRQAKKLVDEARQVVTAIESLNEQDRLTLATYLLFKNRPS
jgi:uncharacterized protein (UPF0332 family)